ncbi:MAG: ATP-binding cassette domain-containing protein, partial [Vulcanimicrobiaceae bacterium]
MIFCDQVGKTFPSARRLGARLRLGAPPVGRTVLHDISFSVARGEIFGLLGANGAGKTTLLKLMATLVAPSVG